MKEATLQIVSSLQLAYSITIQANTVMIQSSPRLHVHRHLHDDNVIEKKSMRSAKQIDLDTLCLLSFCTHNTSTRVSLVHHIQMRCFSRIICRSSRLVGPDLSWSSTLGCAWSQETREPSSTRKAFKSLSTTLWAPFHYQNYSSSTNEIISHGKVEGPRWPHQPCILDDEQASFAFCYDDFERSSISK